MYLCQLTEDTLNTRTQTMLNPLIDEIFDLILTKEIWRVHTLSSELQNRDAIKKLDENPERDLFKRNFLIMNALYQLQIQLHPQQLLVSGLHIELLEVSDEHTIIKKNNLSDYYLNWENYDTTESEIDELLTTFWQQFKPVNTTPGISAEDYKEMTEEWALPNDFTIKHLQKRWRQLAIKNHPDKPGGNEVSFKKIKLQYEQLKNIAR